MVVTDQINALRALGTDPIRKLVVPRVLAGIFMAPVLTVDRRLRRHRRRLDGRAVSAAGGVRPLLVVGLRGALHAGRLDGAHQAVRARVRHRHASPATSGCGRRGGTQGVGRATTKAVVAGSVAVIAVDFFVTRHLISLMLLTRTACDRAEPAAEPDRSRRRTMRSTRAASAPVVVVRARAAGVRRQGRAEGRQLHAAVTGTRRSFWARADRASRRL